MPGLPVMISGIANMQETIKLKTADKYLKLW